MSETVWKISMAGDTWERREWSDVESDVLNACAATVHDCEQEICLGHYFGFDPLSEEYDDDDAHKERQRFINALYNEVMPPLERGLQQHPNEPVTVRVAPWYAVEQRMTFDIRIAQEEDA